MVVSDVLLVGSLLFWFVSLSVGMSFFSAMGLYGFFLISVVFLSDV